MIKLVSKNEIKEKHRVLCPNCNNIIDLVFKIDIEEIPGGLVISSEIFSEYIALSKASNAINCLNLKEINNISTNNLKVVEG